MEEFLFALVLLALVCYISGVLLTAIGDWLRTPIGYLADHPIIIVFIGIGIILIFLFQKLKENRTTHSSMILWTLKEHKEMNRNKDRNPFMFLLAGISLIADVLTLYQFISSGNLFLFWTFQWIVSIVFVFGFFWAGVGLLQLGQSPESAELVMIVFGIGYLIASLIVYIFFSIEQISEGLLIADYLGFATLLGVSLCFGNLSINIVNKKILRYPSYGYGLAGLLLAIALVNKYVFSGHGFEWENFVGEIMLLIAGSVIFLTLYTSMSNE